jgi:hypothetical protein
MKKSVNKTKNVKFSKQKHKLVFSIGDDGCIITCFLDNTLVKRVFAVNPLSSEFESVIMAYPNAEIYVVIDTIDQTFNISLLPPVGARYRNKIINRKIQNDFDKNDFNYYLKIGREANQRKDWKYLFLSVRNAPPVSDWLDVIIELPNKFVGAYLFPLESVNFINDLRSIAKKETPNLAPASWEVLVSHNRVGGIRQVVLKDGAFIFTRISQVTSATQDLESVSAAISQEAINTLEYIRRIGYNDDQKLNIYFVCTADAAKNLDELSSDSMSVFAYNPHKISTELNLKDVAQPNDKYCDVVFAADFITNKKHVLKIVTPKLALVNKMEMLISAVKGASALIVALLILASGYYLYQSYLSYNNKGNLAQEVSDLTAKLSTTSDFSKDYSIDPLLVIEMIKIKNDSYKNDKSFLELMKKISDKNFKAAKATKITYVKNDTGTLVGIDYTFYAKSYTNSGDLLVDSDAFAEAIKGISKDYKIDVKGLLSESKEFKINSETATKLEDLKILVTITW